MRKVKECLYCGKEFYPARKTRMFCSRICAANYRQECGEYIVSFETRVKMSNSHKGKPAWNANISKHKLDVFTPKELEKFKRETLFDISKYTLLYMCINAKFPGTIKWSADNPIWNCYVAGKVSPKEAWKDPKLLLKAIDNLFDIVNKSKFKYPNFCIRVGKAFHNRDISLLRVILDRFTIAKIAPKVTALMPSAFERIIEETKIDISSGIYCPMAGFGGIIEGAKRYYEKHNINAEIEAYDINPIFCNYYGWQQRDVLAQHIKTNKVVFVCPPFGPNTERWKGTPDSMYYEFEEWVKLIKKHIEAPNYIFVGPEINSNTYGLFAKKYGIQWYPEYSILPGAPESTESA